MTRIRLAWHILRGHTVAYRLTLRDGGIDVSDRGKAYVTECTVINTHTGYMA